MYFPQFSKYEAAVRSFAGDPQSPSLQMVQEGQLSVYYAPFDWVNSRARLVLVGITPGKVQAANALAEAKRALQSGEVVEVALSRAKQTGAFSGPMRPNLIALLDRIGLQDWLGLSSCGELFTTAGHLLQTASALQFPVYVDGANYNGSPDPTKTEILRAQLLEHFLPMTRMLPDAVYIPLGPVPTKALTWLASQGHVRSSRVLAGVPHPSGANAERIAYFLGRKARSSLSLKTDPEKLDQAREELVKAVRGLRAPG